MDEETPRIESSPTVSQAWQAQAASVIYVLTRVNDRQDWVTKSPLCAECPPLAHGGRSRAGRQTPSHLREGALGEDPIHGNSDLKVHGSPSDTDRWGG